MNINANTIINRNLYWKIREIINDQFSNWTVGTHYGILGSYPENAEDVMVYPTFVIDTSGFDGMPYELGAKDRVRIRTEFVVMSDNLAQRDMLNMFLWDQFHGKRFTLYDMSTTEPSVAGDYSGLSTLGKFYSHNVNVINIPVPIKIDDKRLRYESTLFLDIECPNFN